MKSRNNDFKEKNLSLEQKIRLQSTVSEISDLKTNFLAYIFIDLARNAAEKLLAVANDPQNKLYTNFLESP